MIALGRAEEVRVMLTPQVQALATGSDIDPMLVLETHVVLAGALDALGDKSRARASIAEADRLSAANPDRPDMHAVVNDWHAKHR